MDGWMDGQSELLLCAIKTIAVRARVYVSTLRRRTKGNRKKLSGEK